MTNKDLKKRIEKFFPPDCKVTVTERNGSTEFEIENLHDAEQFMLNNMSDIVYGIIPDDAGQYVMGWTDNSASITFTDGSDDNRLAR